uniref:Putative secreted protein n=1 Tax=Anopheles marajoara TaxID=58244 RepID=A0A2M4CFG5_9DIPT
MNALSPEVSPRWWLARTVFGVPIAFLVSRTSCCGPLVDVDGVMAPGVIYGQSYILCRFSSSQDEWW